MHTQGLDHAALGLLHTLDGLGVDGDVARLGASEAHLKKGMRIINSTMPMYPIKGKGFLDFLRADS